MTALTDKFEAIANFVDAYVADMLAKLERLERSACATRSNTLLVEAIHDIKDKLDRIDTLMGTARTRAARDRAVRVLAQQNRRARGGRGVE